MFGDGGARIVLDFLDQPFTTHMISLGIANLEVRQLQAAGAGVRNTTFVCSGSDLADFAILLSQHYPAASSNQASSR